METEAQRVAVARHDGSVSIVSIITRAPLSAFSPDAAAANGFVAIEGGWERQIDDAAIQGEIDRLGKSDNAGWRRIDASEVPADRTFREAWKDTGKVEVDMSKARDIHRDRLRALRKPLLDKLDMEFQRAYKDPAELDAIEARKQVLRDVTADPAIEAAVTPEELKAVLPEVLREGDVRSAGIVQQ